jgi:hypothetical protein
LLAVVAVTGRASTDITDRQRHAAPPRTAEEQGWLQSSEAGG